MLTQQLRDLEQDGIVISTVHHEVPKVVYRIDPGEAKRLRTLTDALRDWANYWASRSGAVARDRSAGKGRVPCML
jgi:DNA-binding HxlR family transcriptional regulator